MRDIALLCVYLASVPYMLRRPSLAIIMWVWLSVMNPHRLSYGFAFGWPWAAATAGIAVIAMFATKDERRLPMTPPVVALAMFVGWMCLTSLFPFHSGEGYEMWSKVMKIMFMTFIALAAIRTQKHIHMLVWVIVASLGFYGVKGGFFTLTTGGSFLVWGPPGSFIEGNNEVALALIMVIPLMRYVQIGLKKKWHVHAMTGAMGLTVFSAIGSHSRGALLGIVAMTGFLWVKSRNKFVMAIVVVVAGIAVLSFMPQEWFARMNTIKSYDEDESALGRINAWMMAFRMASSRLIGGGFEIYDPDVFARFAPNPTDVHAAHSIYFQILGEHGFPGLLLFMSVGAMTWLAAGDAKRRAKGIESLAWVAPLMDMVKVSMVGYGVGGAFLSLAYFDVPYYMTVIVVSTRELALAAQRGRLVPTRRDSSFSARRERFGSVVVEDGAPIVESGPPPVVRPERWQGQAVYRQTPARLASDEP